MTFDETAKIIAVISAAIPGMNQKDLYFTQQVWHEIMGSYDYALIKAATIRVLMGATTWPTPAHIIHMADILNPAPDAPPLPEEAWAELMPQLNRYASPKYSHPIIKKTVDSIGYLRLCESENPEWVRSQFISTYKTFLVQYKDNKLNEKVKEITGYKPLYELTEKISEKLSLEQPKEVKALPDCMTREQFEDNIKTNKCTVCDTKGVLGYESINDVILVTCTNCDARYMPGRDYAEAWKKYNEQK